MPIRLRKFIGAILLILLVVTWALLAMAFAQSPLVKANGVIEVGIAATILRLSRQSAHATGVAPSSVTRTSGAMPTR